jgi:hypothetical protein
MTLKGVRVSHDFSNFHFETCFSLYFDRGSQLNIKVRTIVEKLAFTILKYAHDRSLDFRFQDRHGRETLRLMLLSYYLVNDSHACELNRHQFTNFTLA